MFGHAISPATGGGAWETALGQKARGFLFGCWEVRRIVGFAVAVLFLCAGAVLEWYFTPHFRHDPPAKYALMDAKGRPLAHFFEGLPVRRVSDQNSAFPSASQLRPSEPDSESLFRRWGSLFARFFGFSSTVYAQTNCSGCGCVLAHMDCTGQHCDGGTFSTPSWCDGSNNQGVDVGNTTGCGCGIYDWTTCTNSPSNCPS